MLMVFLIQNTQNRDGSALQLKIDELLIRRLRELLDEMAVHTTLEFLYYSWEVRSVPEAGSISPDGKLDSPRARAAMAEYCSFNWFKSSSLKSSRLMNAF